MKIVWSLPVRGERLNSHRGDLVRAAQLIEGLRADGHVVTVVEDAGRPTAQAIVLGYRSGLRQLLPNRAALVLRDLGRWLWARGLGRTVAAVAAQIRADLIVETQVHFAGSGSLATKRTGIPLVLDDCSPSSEEMVLGAGLPGLARRVFRQQGRAARALVVSSYALRDRLLVEGIARRKLFVVPNGICVTAYDGIDAAKVRRRLDLPQGLLACFVGSFQPWHGTEFLADALAGLGENDLHLLLVGDGPGLPPMMARARALGVGHRITSLGPVPAAGIPELIAACDFGLLPASNDYGQPMKLLEYAAARLAIVAPDLPPVREVVEHEHTALLFPAGDLEAFIETLERLVREPELQARLGRQARTGITGNASWRDRARALQACASLRSEGHGEPDKDQLRGEDPTVLT